MSITINKWVERATKKEREKVADEAGVHQKYLMILANGGSETTLGTAIKIARAAKKIPNIPPPSVKSMVSRDAAKVAVEFVEMIKSEIEVDES